MEARGAYSMTIGTSRRGLFTTSALAGALALSIAGGAAAQERVYSIPAQSLAASLRDYGMASGEQIIFAETIVSGRQAPALQGAYGSDEALSFLLADSGLIAERVATGGIMIRRADAPQSGSAAGDGAEVDALIAIGTSWMSSSRFCAVTISASTSAPSPAALPDWGASALRIMMPPVATRSATRPLSASRIPRASSEA